MDNGRHCQVWDRPASPAEDPFCGFAPEFRSIIDVGKGGERLCTMKKTVVVVAVDEGEFGVAVTESWKMRRV